MALPPSPHLVVDTLNLTWWLRGAADERGGGAAPRALSTEEIVDTVDRTAPILRARYPGRLMYVVKDRDSILNSPETRDAYAAAAARNRCYVVVTERYPPGDFPDGRSGVHAAAGRDDFYMGLLARRLRAPVLTEDRFRDFDSFRAEVPPFHVYEFAYWRDAPERDYVRPSATRAGRRPPAVRYAEAGLQDLRDGTDDAGGGAPQKATADPQLPGR